MWHRVMDYFPRFRRREVAPSVGSTLYPGKFREKDGVVYSNGT